jgi:hypothetical protein
MASGAPRPASTGAFSPVGAPRPAPTAGVPQPMPGLPASRVRASVADAAAPTPMAGVPRPAAQPLGRPITQPGASPARAAAAGGLRGRRSSSGVAPFRAPPVRECRSSRSRASPGRRRRWPRAGSPGPGRRPLPPVPAAPAAPATARGRDPFGLSAPANTPVRGYQVEQRIAPPAAAEEMSARPRHRRVARPPTEARPSSGKPWGRPRARSSRRLPGKSSPSSRRPSCEKSPSGRCASGRRKG